MESFSLKKFQQHTKEDDLNFQEASRNTQKNIKLIPKQEIDFLKRMSILQKITQKVAQQKEQIKKRDSKINVEQQPILRLGSPGMRKSRQQFALNKSPEIKSEDFYREMKKTGVYTQIQKVEEVKQFLNTNIIEQQKGINNDQQNQSKLLSFQRRARSKSPPLIFGKFRNEQEKQNNCNSKVMACQEIFNYCSESTQASSRQGTLDYQKNTLSDQVKDFINNQLGNVLEKQQLFEDEEFLNLLNKRLSNTSNDQEFEQWIQGQQDNPFDLAHDINFEELRDSLISTSRSDSTKQIECDWLYQTTNK